MDQLNSLLYQRLASICDLEKAKDTKFIHNSDWIKITNFARDNTFFFLIKIMMGKYQSVVRVWRNSQAEVVLYFDTDWHEVYRTNHGIEIAKRRIQKQANNYLADLLN